METPNLSYIKELAQGDTAFEEQLLQVIRTEFPDEVMKYKVYMEGGDLQKAAEMVHKIKHKISIFGMEESHGVASTFENNLRDGNRSLQTEFEAILNAITEFLTRN